MNESQFGDLLRALRTLSTGVSRIATAIEQQSEHLGTIAKLTELVTDPVSPRTEGRVLDVRHFNALTVKSDRDD